MKDHPNERQPLYKANFCQPLPDTCEKEPLSTKDHPSFTLQWGTVGAEIKDPAVEKPQLKGSPFKAWNKSE